MLQNYRPTYTKFDVCTACTLASLFSNLY